VGKIEIRFQELTDLIPKFEQHSSSAINTTADALVKAFKSGNKVLICGNGGSAADSQHFAAEFVNSFSRDLDRRALPAIALSTDTSILTSIANDFEFENIYSRQVEAYGLPGDVLIVLTTSGSSKNCLKAIDIANSMGLTTIAFTKEKGQVSTQSQISIEVPSQNTQHIQECHMLAYHVITELVEDALFRKVMTQ
jgi:D-sedoheptulose 7-phosphate isomerase